MSTLRRALAAACGLLAAVALFALMLLTLADVSGRKLLSTSLPGALELTELLMVCVIFAGLPLVTLAGEHATFDTLDRWLGPAVRRVQQAVVDLLCAAALLGLAWLMWGKAGQMAAFGDVTAQLKLPLPPFVHGMSVLCALTALLQLLLVAAPVAHHHAGVAAEDDRAATGPA